MRLPDACPECDPLTHPASLSDARGAYECPSGHRWRTTRDAHGWPVERTSWRHEAELRDAQSAGWLAAKSAAA